MDTGEAAAAAAVVPAVGTTTPCIFARSRQLLYHDSKSECSRRVPASNTRCTRSISLLASRNDWNAAWYAFLLSSIDACAETDTEETTSRHQHHDPHDDMADVRVTGSKGSRGKDSVDQR